MNSTLPNESLDREISGILVGRNAVSFRTNPFFTFTSGTESPVYVDNRLMLGYVVDREKIVDGMIEIARAAHDIEEIDAVAGTATAGIPWASWISAKLKLPSLYVRSEAKKWGHERRVEGAFEKGMRVLLVEDLVFTAGSLVASTKSLREEGLAVHNSVTIVTYNTKATRENAENAEVTLSALTSVDTALAIADEQGKLPEGGFDIVRDWISHLR